MLLALPHSALGRQELSGWDHVDITSQFHLTITSQGSHQLQDPPHCHGVPLLPHVAVLHQHLQRPDVSQLSVLPGLQFEVIKVSPSESKRFIKRKFSKLSRASILAAPGAQAQCCLMCIAAHKYEQLLHAGLPDSVNNKQIKSSRRQFQSQAHPGLTPASDPEEGEGSRLREANLLYRNTYNNCLFSSVSNLQ